MVNRWGSLAPGPALASFPSLTGTAPARLISLRALSKPFPYLPPPSPPSTDTYCTVTMVPVTQISPMQVPFSCSFCR